MGKIVYYVTYVHILCIKGYLTAFITLVWVFACLKMVKKRDKISRNYTVYIHFQITICKWQQF